MLADVLTLHPALMHLDLAYNPHGVLGLQCLLELALHQQFAAALLLLPRQCR